MGCRLFLTVLIGIAMVPVAARAQAKPSRPEVVIDSQGFTTTVSSLDFSPDGRWLAAGGGDKVVRIWDVQTGELLWTLRGERGDGPLGEILCVRFSPSGRELLVSVSTFHRGQSVRIYNTNNFDEISSGLPGIGASVAQMAFCRDTPLLATGDEESRVTFWDWRTRKPIRSVQVDIVPTDLNFLLPAVLVYQDQSGPKGHIPSLEWGRYGMVKAVEKYHTLFEIENPQETIKKLSTAENDAIEKAAQVISAAVVNGTKSQTSPYTGLMTTLWQLRMDRVTALAAGRGARPDGSSVYWAGTIPLDGVKPWTAYYDKHRYLLTALRLNHDATLAATGDMFGEVHVWDAKTGRQKHRFQGLARPTYNVAFDSTGNKLGYGTTAFGADKWRYNNYSELHRSFEFNTRRLSDVTGFNADRSGTKRGNLQLEAEEDTDNNLYWLLCKRAGTEVNRLSIAFDLPRCFGFVRTKDNRFGDVYYVGTLGGSLRLHDVKTSMYRRFFHGHSGFVTSAADSPDGRFLVSSCTDGIIRIHSLENFQPIPMADFFSTAGFITQLVPGGHAEKAGFKIGDRVVKVDNYTLAEVFDMLLQRRWPYKVGQQATVTVERRDGSPFAATIPLVETSDYAEPLLNLFIARDDEWVAWTPQGYFDSSLGGDRLIGWHVNQGPLKAAKYYPVHQFRKEFYRPDIIDRVLETGRVEMASTHLPGKIEVPEETIGGRPAKNAVVVDLRHEDALEQREPPTIKIVRPRDNAKVKNGKVIIEVEITRTNDLPVKQATFLVGSRPQATVDLLKEDQTQPALVYEQEVTLLPGANKIAVLAANEVSQSLPTTITVNYEPAKKSEMTILPDLYVLSIGIASYKNPDLNLEFAHHDATEFAKSWEQQQGHPYRKVETRVVTDEKATAQNILTEMEWLVRNCTQSDVAVLFFSAHGMRDTRNSYYLATHDIDPENLRGTGVRWTEVTELLKDLKGKVLVFVDTCHSGGITGENRKAINVDDPLRDLVSDDVGAVVFSSSLPREVSLEDKKWGHGAFTKAILDALGDKSSDQDQDGYLSVTEMQFQVEQRVKQLTRGAQHPATQRSTTMPSFNFYGYPKK